MSFGDTYVLLTWLWLERGSPPSPRITKDEKEANRWLTGKGMTNFDPSFDRFVLVFSRKGAPYIWGGPGV